MKPSLLIQLPLRYKPWQGRHLRLVMQDIAGTARQPEHDNRTHLRGAIDWLCRAQDVRKHKHDAGGVAAGWSFEDGWLPSYPETTGYIIETFIAAAECLDRPELVREVPYINHPEVMELARKLKPDLICVFGTSLIRGELLQEGRLGMVNLHGGLSPEYRGAD